MRREMSLSKSAQSVANGAGSGSVQLGPTRYGDEWTAQSAYMVAGTATAEATGVVYLGPPTTNNARGDTESASSGDTATLPSIKLVQGQFLTAVWTGADPGTALTLTIYGTRVIEEG